jgi:hypothetical protein
MDTFPPKEPDINALRCIAAASSARKEHRPDLTVLHQLVGGGYVGPGCFGQLIVTDDGMRLLRENPVASPRAE